MKFKNNTHYISGGILAMSVMIANIINFIFNAFLGRVLSFEEFGIITFINTLFYLVNIFYNALSATMNYHIAYAFHNKNIQSAQSFLYSLSKKIFIINIILSLIWIASVPYIGQFFHVTNYQIIYLFSLVILTYPFVFINRGYLQGKFLFILAATLVVYEPLIKLLSALGLVLSHNPDLTYFSLYISSFTVVLASILLIIFARDKSLSKTRPKDALAFSSTFYLSSLITGLSTISFLALDVILVKHYLNPKIAGEYSLLSLIGKIIYFLGSLLNLFTISLVSRIEGQNKNSKDTFYKILFGSIVLTGIGYLMLGLFGNIFVPLLFGKKSLAIVSYTNIYCLAILIFTITNIVVTYHLAKKQYTFPIVALIMSLGLIFGIMLFHQNISEIVNAILFSSIANCIVIFLMHLKFVSQKQISINTISVLEGVYD